MKIVDPSRLYEQRAQEALTEAARVVGLNPRDITLTFYEPEGKEAPGYAFYEKNVIAIAVGLTCQGLAMVTGHEVFHIHEHQMRKRTSFNGIAREISEIERQSEERQCDHFGKQFAHLANRWEAEDRKMDREEFDSRTYQAALEYQKQQRAQQREESALAEGRYVIETFSAAFTTSQSPKTGTFSGLASCHGNLVPSQPPAHANTFFLPGCWKETLQQDGDKIKVYSGHTTLVGKMLSGQDDEAGGLRFTGSVSMTDAGKEILTLMKDGVLTSLSVGWLPVESEFIRGSELLRRLPDMKLPSTVAARIRNGVQICGESERYRLIKKAKLFHVGVVETPADDMATVSSVSEVNQRR